MAAYLPLVQDLRLAKSKSAQKLVLLWTNPETETVNDLDQQRSQMVSLGDYDIRFLQGAKAISEESFERATPVRFYSDSDESGPGSKVSKVLASSSGKAWASARIYHGHFKLGEVCLHIYFGTGAPGRPTSRPQFRERHAGAYALKYYDRYYGWSPVSNSVYDSGDLRIHKLMIQVGGSAGVSAGPVGAGVMGITIEDPATWERVRYNVYPMGLTSGARIGLTGSPGSVEFEPHVHVHAGDFDGMGINLLSQGGAIAVGYSRADAYIFDDPRYALTMDRARGVIDWNHVVAGPIDLGGFQMGFEANLLSLLVGKLNKV